MRISAQTNKVTLMKPTLLRPAIVLGLMSLIGPFSMDMYLPAMPEIANNLGTTAQGMQSTISFYIAAFGLAQLVYGPWADQAGRKPPLYAGLALYAVGTLLCILAGGVQGLIFGRIVQGFGAAAMMVVPRAIIRDMATGEDATRLMALMMLVFSVSPLLAPLTGSALMALASWRAVFGALLVTSGLCLALLHFAQPETLRAENAQIFSFASVRSGAARLIRDRGFVTLTLMGTAAMSSFFVFLAAAPFVYTQHYGLTPTQFSLAFAVNAMSFIGVGQLAGPLGARFGAVTVMRAAAVLFVCGMGAAFALALAGLASLTLLVLLMALGNAGVGLIIPTSMVMALEDQGANAGLASSIGGTFQMIAGGLIVALAGPILSGDPAPMMGVISLCALATLALAMLVPKRERA